MQDKQPTKPTDEPAKYDPWPEFYRQLYAGLKDMDARRAQRLAGEKAPEERPEEKG